jgi:hypothetical protein
MLPVPEEEEEIVMKRFSAIAAVIATASAAFASTIPAAIKPTDASDTIQHPGALVNFERTGVVVPFEIHDIPSWDDFGSPNNHVVMFDVAAAIGLPHGSPVKLTGVGWETVRLTAFDPSWQSEMFVYLNDSANVGPDGVLAMPAPWTSIPGTGLYSTGLFKLNAVGRNDLLLPDGMLRLEFGELLDNAAGVQDGVWSSGTLHLQFVEAVPEPASFGLLSLAALALLRRR